MKINYERNIIDDITDACVNAPRKVASVELTKDERHALYLTGDARFVKCKPYARAMVDRAKGFKGYRGFIRVSGRFALPVLAAEEQS